MRTARFLLAGLLVSLVACGGPEPTQPAPPPEQGRPETRKVLAADAAGYDGQALRSQLDKVLDVNDQHVKETEAAQQAEQEP